MLELKNISKSYTVAGFTQKALSNIDLKFRKSEFVSILGHSGSGKTTMLNIISGLDRYDTGDLIINNKSTKDFKDSNWDSYRNNCIGFIFQNYNLISHISVLDNVEMGMTLSGMSKNKKKKKALEVLEKVGLKNHANKKPNQLSGGQMQRVAIARALANDPDIILADEPTGALDSKTSIQIMDLIKEISKDKLVIMVTHNRDLAYTYSSRIIELSDGKIIDDTNPVKEKEEDKIYKIKKTAMNFKTALSLSFNNIKTKKGRTILTAFASSIGIIGIALILSLSNGFDLQIDKYEHGILSAMPVFISEQSMNLNSEAMEKLKDDKLENYPDIDYIIPVQSNLELLTHTNKITKDFVDYVKNMPKEYSYGYSFYRITNLNLFQKYSDGVKKIETSNLSFASIPTSFEGNESVMEEYYDLLTGHFANDKNEIMVIVDSKNRVTDTLLEILNLDTSANVSFDTLLNSTIHLSLNDSYYIEKNGFFTTNSDLNKLYNDGLELKIVGVIRMKEDFPSYVQSSSLVYTEDLMNYIISNNSNSKIVKAQKEKDYNILSGIKFTNDKNSMTSSSMTKESMLSYLGDDTVPFMIYLYPKDFNSKDDLISYLDKYNEGKNEDDKLIYTDQANLISSMSSGIMDAVTIVLISFSSISLVVSSIMIGIITYISVLERTKEIGILRSLGARKKDITRVFNAETFIIGSLSGIIGILIARLLIIPANMIIYNLTDLKGVAVLNPIHALLLLLISILITLIGGFIPARMASKKDPVIALRTE